MKVEYQPQKMGNQGNASEEEEGGGIDWDKVAGYARFVSGSLKRRKFMFAGVLVVVLGLTYAIYWMLPRSYHVETQLLAQRNQVIPSLAVSGRSIQDLGPPTRAAAETVLRRDNLVALIQQADLVANWARTRSGAARIRGWISRTLFGKFPSDEDITDILLGTLEDKLTVKVNSDNSGEGTVTIALDWGDARMGYRIVTAAQQSFIEARHLTEISSISEALSILVSRATTMRKEIDSTVRALEERSQKKGEPVPRRRVDGTARSTRLAAAVDAGVAAGEREATQQILAQWEGKKTAIKDLEDMRRKRIAELQTKLAELRATYADGHPTIVDTVQTIETLSAESPQLVQLRKEEAALHNQYLARTAKVEPMEGPPQPIVRDNTVKVVAMPSAADDRETEFAKNQLRFQADAYDRVLERIESAQMEMEAARAAFKHRFVVVRPAQVPRTADKPKPAKVLGGGVAAAFVLALLAAIAADLRSGRVYASWQLERALRLPVLAEIRRDRER